MITKVKTVKPQTVKGFQDYYPQEMAFRNWLFGKMRKVSRLYGYEEYEAPILEPIELYEAKSGEELVKRQTFQLTDRGGRKLALRPELTPSLARMVAAGQNEMTLPIRWFSIGPRFRYETPQKGRGREFYQWDIDLVGVKTPEADAEIIAAAASFFESLGLTAKEIVIKVNNRRLMNSQISMLDIPKNQIPGLVRLIDKKEKIPEADWIRELERSGLRTGQIKGLRLILEENDFSDKSEELTATFSALKDLGVADYVEFDPTVVRGLDYYTGTVFEAKDRKGKFRSILGGGRYDNLVEVFGGRPLSGIGFACGDMAIGKVLKEYGKGPASEKINPCPTRVLVTVFNEALCRDSFKITAWLRKKGVNVEIYPDPKVKLKKQLKYADRKGIPVAVIIGPEELLADKVKVKDLSSGKQMLVEKDKITALLGQQ